MWKPRFTLVAVVAVAVAVIPAQEAISRATEQTRADEEHTQWITHVMKSIATIQPGMARRDISELFGEEGGLSTRTQRTYVYKHCPYIKVIVEFTPFAGSINGPGAPENPADSIIRISRPFLEYTIAD
jgi:hypothetical protein